MKRLTLEEIGRMAGVSRSTVSRVINDRPEVSDDVKLRVLEVIDRTGFHPNQAARSLVSKRTGVLGLVIPSSVHSLFEDPYFGRLIQGIASAANRAEKTLTLFMFENEREEIEIYNRVIGYGLVDGLIVTATKMDNPLIDRLLNDGGDFVMVGRPDSDGIAHVDVENRKGARSATRHLLDHGYREVGLISAPTNTTTGVDRRLGFLDEMASAGIAVPTSRIADGDFTERSGFQAMSQLLHDRPDAVFCASDTMALGAIKAIRSAGLECPDDVALVGFDGMYDANASRPSLTTVSQPVRETGEAAVELLLEVIAAKDGAQPTAHILPTELTIRRSCGCGTEPS